MKFIHYSNEPLENVYSVTQDNALGFKPRGLWFSPDMPDGWKQWCEDNDFAYAKLEHCTRIKIKDDSSILHVGTSEALDEFTDQYVLPGRPSNFNIDWRAVARKYQGIIIAPYRWDRRLSMHTFWYYAWDCASGCVWDADAVHSLIPDV